MGRRLMNQHGLGGWVLTYDRSVRRAGCCMYSKQTISLSRALTQSRPEAEVRNTILHEIAHALTPGHGHDRVWQRKAREIGCDGNRTYSTAAENLPEPKWVGVCPNGHTAKRHRRSSRPTSCAICSPRFDTAYLITWYPNNMALVRSA